MGTGAEWFEREGEEEAGWLVCRVWMARPWALGSGLSSSLYSVNKAAFSTLSCGLELGFKIPC